MKKGMILYVTKGKDEVPLQGGVDLVETSRSLGVAVVSVATTEEDVVYGWWFLVTKGVRQVFFMVVAYDAALKRFEPRGDPARLWG